MRDSSRQSQKDRGTAQVLLMRLENERLPFALKLKDKVDHGEVLSDYDTQFLKRVLKEAGDSKRLAAKLPQYQEIVQRMSDLYEEITRKGLENQKNPPPPPPSRYDL